METTLRALRPDDIAAAGELTALARWNQTEEDWRGYVALERDGCFVAERAGRTVGTVTTLRYDASLGWIGMVLVHPACRRHGIGTALLHHAMASLERKGVACIKLDATPLGRKVYEPLGFRAEYDVFRYEGIAPPAAPVPAPAAAVPVAATLAGVVAFDAGAFGVERARVLAALSRRQPAWCLQSRDENGVNGYLIAREGREAVQLGPWAARDGTVAADLWRAFLARAAGRRVFVDVPAPNRVGGALLERHGFSVQRTFTRMYRGENIFPGDPRLVFGSGGAEKG